MKRLSPNGLRSTVVKPDDLELSLADYKKLKYKYDLLLNTTNQTEKTVIMINGVLIQNPSLLPSTIISDYESEI